MRSLNFLKLEQTVKIFKCNFILRINNSNNINEIMKNPGKIPFVDNQQKAKYIKSPRTPMPKANFVEINKILGR